MANIDSQTNGSIPGESEQNQQDNQSDLFLNPGKFSKSVNKQKKERKFPGGGVGGYNFECKISFRLCVCFHSAQERRQTNQFGYILSDCRDRIELQQQTVQSDSG